MPLKTITIEDKVYAEVQDGKPVYTLTDGTEQAYDGEALSGQVTQLTQTANQNQAEVRKLQGQLKTFDGLDVDAARKALETVANLDEGTLIKSQQVTERINAATATVTAERDEARKQAGNMASAFAQKMIDGQFGMSKFVQEKVVVPPDMMSSMFAKHFSVEDLETNPRIVGKDALGNPLYSKANPGSPATFEESLEQLVDAYPHKDHILKGNGKPGTGAPGGGNGTPGSKVLPREEAERLSVTDPLALKKKLSEEGFSIAAA